MLGPSGGPMISELIGHLPSGLEVGKLWGSPLFFRRKGKEENGESLGILGNNLHGLAHGMCLACFIRDLGDGPGHREPPSFSSDRVLNLRDWLEKEIYGCSKKKCMFLTPTTAHGLVPEGF